MMRRLAMLMVNAYPLAFRRRYGDEMRVLLHESPTRMVTLLDLLRGAFAAHLRPPQGPGGVVGTSDRLRASASGVLACWVIFAAAGFGFYKTTENTQFSTAGGGRLLLGGAHLAVRALAMLASFALVIGATPLILAALGRARRERSLRVVVSLPIAAVAVFACLTAAIVWVANSGWAHHATGAARGALIAWIFAGWACATVCVVAARRALFAVPIPPRRLGAALLWGTLVTAAMALITVAVALYTVVQVLDASRLADQPNGPWFINTSTWLSLTMQLIVMAISAALATITTLRGWRVLRPCA